jgi:hypothetical protein
VAAERVSEGRAREWLELKREAIARASGLLPDCRVVWFADAIHDIPLQHPLKLVEEIKRFALSLAR